jgi:OPA family glycerol-3-phosphate transporter-like MFS transporter
VPQEGAGIIANNWGLWLCVFGIAGGFFAGGVSDYFFQSRRGPPAAILASLTLAMTVLMAVVLAKAPLVLGFACLMILLASVGLTSIMSGTAATDFGGRKATATCAGIVDGFTYLGSGIQSFFIGHLIPAERAGESATFLGITRDWHWWPIFMVPFAVLGICFAIAIWHALPEATKKFNALAKQKGVKLGVVSARVAEERR